VGEDSDVTDAHSGGSDLLRRIAHQETLNFLLTNRIPRRLATSVAGRIARIENRWLTRMGIALWQAVGGSLDLHEAEARDYTSLESVFTRRLSPGARSVDPSPEVLTSPCDAIVGAHGVIEDGMAIQAKGFAYPLGDLLLDPALVARYLGGRFVTLRLRSTMYHRFHAPCDGRIASVTWIAGETWNVNPVALRRIDRIFCKNERVVIDVEGATPHRSVTLVAVAAILVSSVHLECLPTPPRSAAGRLAQFPCNAPVRKGDEVGHFRNGSTIILFAPRDFEFCPSLTEGQLIRMGQPLLHTCPP
jgi:phosphatidylserine decarboxylase